MEFARFFSAVIKLAVALALAGQLKGCTLTLLGKAAKHAEIMSYSKFTRALTR